MANKYQLRRRALRESRGRSDNPFASPRYGETQSHSHTPPPRVDRPWIAAGICFGFVLLITVLYVQTGRHNFTVCDDNDYIYKNPMVTRGLDWEGVKWAWSDSHAGNWHPLTWMSHMLDWQLFGAWQPENSRYINSNPGYHHLVSMGIHCANAVLLFLALRLMTGTLWPCVVVTALFALHPLRVESVAWAAERKDVLCGLFWMASMLAYAFYVRRPPLFQSSLLEVAGTLGIYGLVTLFFGLALLAKSMAVTLPCVFLLLDAWPLDRWRKALWPPGRRAEAEPNFISASRLLLEKLPWFAMVIYDCLQTVVGQDKGVALNSWEGLPLAPRITNALASIPAYLGQMCWPAGMAPFYPHPHMYEGGWNTWTYFLAAIGGIILVGVTAAVICFWRKTYLAVGWFWFLGALVPVIGILQVGTQSRADRYTYLPMIGVYLMIVWLLKEVADRWPETRIVLAAASVLVFTALSAVTFQQASYWINSYRLFEHAVEVTDNNWFAYNHIGIQYDQDGMELLKIDPQAAQEKFDHSAKAFAAAIKIKPDYDFGNNNLGVYYARKDEPKYLELAEKYFRGALHSNLRYADAYNNLGIILRRQGQAFLREGKATEGQRKLRESVECHLNGLKVRNDRASDHNNLGETYRALGDWDHAIEQNELALRFDRNFVGAWFVRAELFKEKNELDKVADCLKAIVRIDPKSPESIDVRFKLGVLYTEQKRFDEAIDWFTQILAIHNDLPQAYFARGRAYEQKGDLNHAKEDFQQVERLVPQNPEVQEKLRAIRAQLADPRK